LYITTPAAIGFYIYTIREGRQGVHGFDGMVVSESVAAIFQISTMERR
jgi:hypothetical protein